MTMHTYTAEYILPSAGRSSRNLFVHRGSFEERRDFLDSDLCQAVEISAPSIVVARRAARGWARDTVEPWLKRQRSGQRAPLPTPMIIARETAERQGLA
jgi:hypothetical protein